VPFDAAVTDLAGLRQRYRDPHPFVLRKQIDHVDEGARSFIARSSFVLVATASSSGVDVSPRGGPPGFVQVLDEHRIAMTDLSGNNRLDTFINLLDQPRVGMLFVIPGLEETLRVNGRATLTADPAILEATAIEGRAAPVAIGVDVEECFVHCAKALRRGGLWDPARWPGRDERPSPAQLLKDHIGLEFTAEEIEADLEEGYQITMWEPGAWMPDEAAAEPAQ
jgi:uncharacterized protein